MFMLTGRHRRVCQSYEADIRYLKRRLKACEDTERAMNGTRLLCSIRACRLVAQGVKHPGTQDDKQMLERLAYVESLLHDLEHPLLAAMTHDERVSWGLAINDVHANPAWLCSEGDAGGAEPGEDMS